MLGPRLTRMAKIRSLDYLRQPPAASPRSGFQLLECLLFLLESRSGKCRTTTAEISIRRLTAWVAQPPLLPRSSPQPRADHREAKSNAGSLRQIDPLAHGSLFSSFFGNVSAVALCFSLVEETTVLYFSRRSVVKVAKKGRKRGEKGKVACND